MFIMATEFLGASSGGDHPPYSLIWYAPFFREAKSKALSSVGSYSEEAFRGFPNIASGLVRKDAIRGK
jgi:hypothetical protein